MLMLMLMFSEDIVDTSISVRRLADTLYAFAYAYAYANMSSLDTIAT